MLRKKDCCGCGDWKSKLNELWEKYQNAVRGVKFGDKPISYPDGDGIVQVDTEGLIDVDQTLDPDSSNPIANAPVAAAIGELGTKNTQQDGRLDAVEGDIDDLEDDISGIGTQISGIGSQISTLEGKIINQNNFNAETRGIANAAKDTADSFESRLEDVEADNATQDTQIAALQAADVTLDTKIDTLDAQNVKLTGNQTIAGVKTFSDNPKVADAASGATDTSAVNAKWVSQSGSGKPNNLVHDHDEETIYGYKVLVNGMARKPIMSKAHKSLTQDYVNVAYVNLGNLNSPKTIHGILNTSYFDSNGVYLEFWLSTWTSSDITFAKTRTTIGSNAKIRVTLKNGVASFWYRTNGTSSELDRGLFQFDYENYGDNYRTSDGITLLDAADQTVLTADDPYWDTVSIITLTEV